MEASDGRTAGQFLRFAIVGSLTAAIYAGGYLALRHLGIATALAATLAYLAAITFQYLGHSAFTFGQSPARRGQIGRFLVLNGAGLLAAIAITMVLTSGAGAPDWVASLVVVTVLPFVNWIFMRLWVFA